MNKLRSRIKSGTYIRLQTGNIVKVELDYMSTTIMCETELGERINLPADELISGERLSYRPSVKEIGALAKKLLGEETDKEIYKASTFFFEKLLEFEHIRINTLGYYTQWGDKRKNSKKDYLKDALSCALSSAIFIASKKELWLKWIDGDTKAGEAYFAYNFRGKKSSPCARPSPAQ